MSEKEPPPRIQVTEEHLKNYAAYQLVDAAGMHKVAFDQCESDLEVIDLLTRSLQTAFHNGYRIASHAEENLSPEQELDIAEGMYSAIRTIGAAALALAPLYDAAVQKARDRRIIRIN